MSAMEILEFVLRGLLLGVTYGVIAIPICLVFVSTGTVDMAMGAYVVLAAAISFTLAGPLGMAAAVLAAIAAAAVVGVLSALLMWRYAGEKMIVILASFGFAIMLESLVLTVFGNNPFVQSSGAGTLRLAGILLSKQSLLAAGIGLVLAGGVYLLLYRSALGRLMRAGADNARGAAIAGIAVGRVQLFTFMLTGALAGIAGLLLLNGPGVMFSSAIPLTITGLGAAIIFGFSRPLMGFVGGLIFGVAESLSAGFAPPGWATLLPLLFIFSVLAIRSLRGSDLAGGRA